MLRQVDEAKRLAALRLVRDGRLYDLGRVLDERSPVVPGRFFRQTFVTTAHHGKRPQARRRERVQLGHRGPLGEKGDRDRLHHLVYTAATWLAYAAIENGTREAR